MNAPEAGFLRLVWHRIYGDLLMPSRLPEYRALLERGLSAGYRYCSVRTFLVDRPQAAGDKCIILRHDVDSDVATAEAQFRIEEDLEIESSFYFRLSTLDPGLMRAIEARGSEASYHYEELATLAKREGIVRPEAALAAVGRARKWFRRNLCDVRAATGLPMLTVASHGDFANRALGIPNHVLLQDPAFRRELGILGEAYDPELSVVDFRCSDLEYPRFWKPESPRRAMDAGAAKIYILTHPRQWRANPVANFRLVRDRIVEGALYRFRGMTTRAGAAAPSLHHS